MMHTHAYGLRPSPRGSFRTFRLPAAFRAASVADTDLRPAMAAAGIGHKDQGTYGSCVFCSGTVAAAYLSRLTHPDAEPADFSVFFPYYQVRQKYLAQDEIPDIDTDCGATGADFIAAARQAGLCSESSWPSDAAHFSAPPSDVAVAEALNHQALEAFAIPYNSVTGIRAALAATGMPVQLGIAVPPELESDAVAESGELDSIADMTLRNILGYHEVLVVASETVDAHGYFWIWNSWGEDWGRDGNCRIPATLLAKLSIEARIMQKIE